MVKVAESDDYDKCLKVHLQKILTEPKSLQLGTSTKTILDSWNTATTRWLRECIYDRVPKRYAVWVVFVVSAMWHGFYPGYYLAFVSAALITVAGRIHHMLVKMDTPMKSQLTMELDENLGLIENHMTMDIPSDLSGSILFL
ncbi:unnamed protein product [Trichobilharzia regenti]|nr:unnamed protein product [Trichobilharzia regenti]